MDTLEIIICVLFGLNIFVDLFKIFKEKDMAIKGCSFAGLCGWSMALMYAIFYFKIN